MSTVQATLSPEQYQAALEEIASLRAANAALLSHMPKPKGPTLKISAKGAISLYGMGRFPVTLYASQWETVFNAQDTIKAFIVANLQQLATKEVANG